MDFSVAEAAARVELTEAVLRQALATYVRTILAGGSPYDHYLAGDGAALSAEARAGLAIFRGKGGCVVCHLGPNLTDEQYHNTGVSERDPGREKITGLAPDRGKFKTPSLREVATAPPYMHDGSIGSLEEVVEHYNRGGGRNPNLDPALHELNLTPSEKAALVALLRSFSGTIREGLREGRGEGL
jgi:cytochrome c peroxidase